MTVAQLRAALAAFPDGAEVCAVDDTTLVLHQALRVGECVGLVALVFSHDSTLTPVVSPTEG